MQYETKLAHEKSMLEQKAKYLLFQEFFFYFNKYSDNLTRMIELEKKNLEGRLKITLETLEEILNNQDFKKNEPVAQSVIKDSEMMDFDQLCEENANDKLNKHVSFNPHIYSCSIRNIDDTSNKQSSLSKTNPDVPKANSTNQNTDISFTTRINTKSCSSNNTNCTVNQLSSHNYFYQSDSRFISVRPKSSQMSKTSPKLNYQCDMCSYSTDNIYGLPIHRGQMHGCKAIVKGKQCKAFNCTKHKLIFDPRNRNGTFIKKQYQCEMCDFSSHFEKGLQSHKGQVHKCLWRDVYGDRCQNMECKIHPQNLLYEIQSD